jgi:DNA ligase-1
VISLKGWERMIRVWPTLYRRTSTGAIQQWTVKVDSSTILTEYGQVNGAIQITSKTATSKNIGKSNETSAEQQAILEAEAMWKKRAELKYTTEISKAVVAEPILPMLAHNFEDRKVKVKYPVFVQPKLDGCRALCYRDFDNGGNIVLMSRQGKPWNVLPHIIKAVELLLPKDSTDVLDGELYIHGVTFQAVTRLVKKHRPESKLITYQIYDVISDAVVSQAERVKYLENLFMYYEYPMNSDGEQVIWNVGTSTANNEAEVYDLQKRYVEVGYEGAIVRIRDAEYKMNSRSNDLLKVKTFKEDEFEIIGYENGVGRYAGCVIWHCITKEGKEFKCVPKGTIEDKIDWFDNGNSYIGKWLTVKYFEMSEDNIPRFPVGLGFKEDR